MKKDVKRKPVRRGRPAEVRGGRGSELGTKNSEVRTKEAERETEKLEPGAAFVGRDSCGRFKRCEAEVVGATKREMAVVAEAEKAVTSAQLDEPGPNPLLDLPEKDRAKLFAWLRECPYDDAVRQVLRDEGMGEVSKGHLSEFFQREAESHWERRIARAAVEANALVQLVERSPVQFSSGILAALGQEAFRQVASGEVEPEAMGKMAMLFLKARSAERADQMQLLRREKLSREMQGQVEQALEKLAEEVEQHPGARAAFEALRRESCEEDEGEAEN